MRRPRDRPRNAPPARSTGKCATRHAIIIIDTHARERRLPDKRNGRVHAPLRASSQKTSQLAPRRRPWRLRCSSCLVFCCPLRLVLAKTLQRFWLSPPSPKIPPGVHALRPPTGSASLLLASLPQNRAGAKKDPPEERPRLAAVSRRSTRAAHARCIHAPRFRRRPAGGEAHRVTHPQLTPPFSCEGGELFSA